jgi:hypothetical protein
MVSASSLHAQVDVGFNKEMRGQTNTGEYQLPPNYLKLNAMEEISDVWSKPPPKRHLHLYVTVLGDQWRQKWCQLDDDDQWKLFGDYWKKQNAQTTSDSLSVTLAYEERGEENPVYRLPLVPQAKNKIIVRVCYKSFYNYILDMRENKYNGLVLTGQPGTGASSS